jgi:hypothetical protein
MSDNTTQGGGYLTRQLQNPKADNLASISQAAKLLSVSTKTIRNWELQGLVTPFKTPGNHRRYRVGDLWSLLGKEEK